MSKLHIGCGDDILQGYINLDIFERTGVDVVHDMNKSPWPFNDNTFEEVYASHILEHVDDLLGTMREIHRVCQHQARVVIRVPHFSCGVTYRDPTHKRAMSYFSFDYFCEAENQYKRQDEGLFVIASKKLNFTRLAWVTCRRLLK